MKPRITVVTLGVKSLKNARAFYGKGLKWKEAPGGNDSVAFYDLGGLVLSVFGREDLAKDAKVPSKGSGFRSVALAQNVSSPKEVNKVLADAKKAGATITKKGEKTFWGGYAGYFADPDGHLWEIAHNPFWKLDKQGRVVFPKH